MAIVVPLLVCRSGCLASLEAGKTAGIFSDNTFEPVEAFRPLADLSDYRNTTRVTIVGLTDDRKRETRGGTVTILQPIQIAVQRLIVPSKIEQSNGLITLWEQVKARLETKPPGRTGENDPKRWTWMETKSLRDEAGTPYEFSRMRENNVFEGIFTLLYQATFSRTELGDPDADDDED